MLARAVSCLAYASTSFANNALSFWVNRSLVWFSLLTCSSRRLTAKSIRGFSGGCGLTTSLRLSVNDVSFLWFSHFFAKCSDKLVFLNVQEGVVRTYALLTCRYTCRCIREGEELEVCYNYPLQNHMLKVEVIDKSVRIPLYSGAIFVYTPLI